MYPDENAGAFIRTELMALRTAVSGALGAVIASADGLVLVGEAGPGFDPHDIAAMAAAIVGIGRQSGIILRQGMFQESVIRCDTGHLVVYCIDERLILAVHTTHALNLARLHLEARTAAPRIAAALANVPDDRTASWFAARS